MKPVHLLVLVGIAYIGYTLGKKAGEKALSTPAAINTSLPAGQSISPSQVIQQPGGGLGNIGAQAGSLTGA